MKRILIISHKKRYFWISSLEKLHQFLKAVMMTPFLGKQVIFSESLVYHELHCALKWNHCAMWYGKTRAKTSMGNFFCFLFFKKTQKLAWFLIFWSSKKFPGKKKYAFYYRREMPHFCELLGDKLHSPLKISLIFLQKK